MRTADIQDDFRLFTCHRCHKQVRICRHCDRGNRYCSDTCAASARREQLREARRRYQRSPIGRERHMLRQRRWRQKRRAVVELTREKTDCREKSQPRNEAVFLERNRQLQAPIGNRIDEEIVTNSRDTKLLFRCSICGKPLGPFARLDFITMIRHARSTRHYRLRSAVNKNTIRPAAVHVFYGFR